MLPDEHKSVLETGLDVTDLLGIVKCEPVLPAQLSGQVKGLFPWFVPKTDQERVQNLSEKYSEWHLEDTLWEVTEKLDGSSMTVYVNNNEAGICSRNYELQHDLTSTFSQVACNEALIEKLKSTGRNLTIQGELVGPGIDTQLYFSPQERVVFCQELGISHAPVLSVSRRTVVCGRTIRARACAARRPGL